MTRLQRRIKLSSDELSAFTNDLRFEFGPSVVTIERAQELRTMLAWAKKDIEDLERQRDILASLLSPIRKLPNETLFRIFQYTCEENLLQSYPWLGSRWQSPTKLTSPVITYLPSMAISSVCSRWRALALSSPSLWTNLAVETHTMSLEAVANLVGFVGTVTRYLERSGNLPLGLALSLYRSSKIYAAEVPSLIHLTQHAHRWKTFKYKGCESLTKHNLLSQLRCPLLEGLVIERLVICSMIKGLDCFEYCPKLCTLSIPERVRPTSKVLHNQLHHINFSYSLTELVEVLRICPSVKSLELGYIKPDLEEGALEPWCNITSVALAQNTSSRTVFSSLNFPSLNRLVVTDGHHDFWQADDFSSFISRSSCLITTFTLLGASMSDLDLMAALRVMPALLHLEVEDKLRPNYVRKYCSPITPHLLSSLTHDESASISLVPRLHSLRFTWRSEPNEPPDDASDYKSDDESENVFDHDAFVGMVESRWFKPGSDLAAEMAAIGKSSIRSVVLKIADRTVDADNYEPLWILDAEGLRVVVSGTNGVQL